MKYIYIFFLIKYFQPDNFLDGTLDPIICHFNTALLTSDVAEFSTLYNP